MLRVGGVPEQSLDRACADVESVSCGLLAVPASGSISAAAATACARAGSYAVGLDCPLKLEASPLSYVYTCDYSIFPQRPPACPVVPFSCVAIWPPFPPLPP